MGRTFPRAACAPGIEAQARQQKTVLLFRNARIALAVNLIIATLLALGNVHLQAPVRAASAWWCAFAAIATGRYLMARRFHPPAADAALRWERRYVGATALVGAAWGAGSVLFMWNAPDGARLVTGLVLAGMVAGCVPILAPAPGALRAFALLVGVPASAATLLQAGSAVQWVFGLGTVVLLAAVLASAHYLHQTLDRSIRLGLEKSELLTSLGGARGAVESALEASVRSEQRYRTMFESAPIGIALTAFDGAIVRANEAMLLMFGYDPKEHHRVDSQELYADPAQPEQWLQIFRQSGALHGHEVQFRRRDGSLFFGSLTVNRLGPERGDVLLVMLEDVTESRLWREKMYHQAHYDWLTNLPNRRLLLDRVNQAMLDARRRGRAAAVLFLDLDNFKEINDSLGHEGGDQLLKNVGARLNDVVRRGDTVCRPGGDEFVIVLADLEQPQDASMISNKILEALAAPVRIGHSLVTIRTSIGISLYPSDAARDGEELIRLADEAMYAAKQGGGNRYRYRHESIEAVRA